VKLVSLVLALAMATLAASAQTPVARTLHIHISDVEGGQSGDRHAGGGEVVGVGQVDTGLGKDHVLVVDARITLDLSDVAALDVPTRVGMRSHLPFQVRLHLGHTVDHALVLDVVAAERALRHLVPTQVDVLGARAELVAELDLVEFDVEAVSHHQHTVGEHAGVLLQLAGDAGVIDGQAVPDLDPGVLAVVTGHVDRLEGHDVFDLGDVGGTHDAQDLVQAGVHAGAVEADLTLVAGFGQQLGHRLAGRVGMVLVAVPTVDPVGGGDDIDPGLKDFHVEVLVGEDTVEREHIRLGGDDLLDRAGRLHPDRR